MQTMSCKTFAAIGKGLFDVLGHTWQREGEIWMKKTKKIMLGVTAALGGTLAGCGDDELPPKPEDPYCSKYEYDYGDDEWECDDTASRHYRYFYVGNTAYPDTDEYKSKKSSIAKGKAKSGFGGSKVSGS